MKFLFFVIVNIVGDVINIKWYIIVVFKYDGIEGVMKSKFL